MNWTEGQARQRVKSLREIKTENDSDLLEWKNHSHIVLSVVYYVENSKHIKWNANECICVIRDYMVTILTTFRDKFRIGLWQSFRRRDIFTVQ